MAMIALAATGSALTGAYADCAMAELGPNLVTRTGAKLPADGGILVAAGVSTDHKPVPGDPSQPKLKATFGGKPVALVIESLAPGLTVYRPEHPLVGAVAVAGAANPLTVTFGKDKGPALVAPAVTAVVSTVVMDLGRHGAEGSETTVVAVKSVPETAVAVIVYHMKDEEHVPITYGSPAHDKTGATTIEVYREGGHCRGPGMPGQAFPQPQEVVTLAWVDASGRLSPLSAPIKVTEGKTK